MKNFLKDLPPRWPFELLGVVVFSLIIWFLFPYVEIASSPIFEGAALRGGLVALVAVAWVVFVLLRARRIRSANAKLEGAITEEATKSSAQEEKLRLAFEEAIAFLRTRGTGKNLYQLPWYVIVGPPGSGKTTALRQSGLNFPLDRKFGKDALRGVGGTRNCDWWFTDDAVLLDTAGRYFSQDSHQATDSAEWQRFLDLLAKYRKRQPINGILVAISAGDLLTMTPSEHDRHVETMRRRIDEIQQHLKVRVPVYVLVTKCDLVAGFVEFFEEMESSERNQVWGMTRPDPSDNRTDISDWFVDEYQQLIERLDAELYERLAEERSTQRRTLLFGFPRRMEAVRDELAAFLQEVFQPHRFDDAIMLRGVYFTSGTQEGTPIDRLMESIASAYGVSADLSADPIEAGTPRSFFLNRLLKEVVFSESGLAGVNWRFEVGRAVAQNSAYVAVLVGTGLLAAAWLASYRANSLYLGEVQASVAANGALLEQPIGCSEGLGGILGRLESLRTISDEANKYDADRPLLMGFGLFQGRTVGEVARQDYLQALQALLLPELVRSFATQIPKIADDATRLFAYLKGYLMLVSSEHRDPQQLSEIVRFALAERFADQPQVAALVSNHFDALAGAGADWMDLPQDDAMVAAARASLQTATVPRLMLGRMKLAYGTRHEHALHLDRELGLGANETLAFRSGRSLSEPVPAVFTKAGFDDLNKDLGVRLVAGFLKDQWVLGSGGNPLAGLDQIRLAADFSDFYEAEYARYWDGMIVDLAVVAPSGCQQTKEKLAQLTGPTSPLRKWYQVVQSNTTLQAAEPQNNANAALAGLPQFGNLVQSAGRAAKPGAAVTQHFAVLHTAMPNVEDLVQSMEAAHRALGDCTKTAMDARALGDAIAGIDLASARAPEGMKKVADGVKVALKNVKDDKKRGDVLHDIRDRYENEVGIECRRITSAYPFQRGAADLKIGDFARFFGAGGVMDGFYQSVLSEHVDASGKAWRWRDEDPAKGVIPEGFLEQFRQARSIRDIFFAGASPRFEFRMQAEELDARANRFSFALGGKTLSFGHGAPSNQSLSWPGEGGDVEYAFDTFSGERPVEKFEGTWGLFRLFDGSPPESVSSGAYRLSLRSKTGMNVRLRMTLDSSSNPLDQKGWRDFRCSSPPAK